MKDIVFFEKDLNEKGRMGGISSILFLYIRKNLTLMKLYIYILLMSEFGDGKRIRIGLRTGQCQKDGQLICISGLI